MDTNWQSRTALLLGEKVLDRFRQCHVLVAGLGGVGAYVAEMLCRAGIGKLTIADGDKIQASNRNRQLLALSSNTGECKVSVMKERLLNINPDVLVNIVPEFLQGKKVDILLEEKYDYVVDAIDSLSPKVFLILKTLKKGYPIISSMGSGGKLDPLKITVCDISESHTCRLAYHIRKHLHKYGVREGVKVVFSPEQVIKNSIQIVEGEKNKKSTVGTISYMPPVFGCIMSSVVIRDLIDLYNHIN